MDQGSALTRLALFGSPVKHSLSPQIHQAFAQQATLDVDYRAVDVDADFLSREIQRLEDAGGVGCNITMPLKNRAFELANVASERVQVARAANTLIFKSRGRWSAHNTDGRGLLRDLQRERGSAKFERVAIIGAGGATSGILYDLLSSGVGHVAIFNRTVERAQELVERFSSFGALEAFALDQMEHSDPFDLVINASSAGHRGGNVTMHPSLFDDSSFCYDLSYGRAHSSLAQWTADREIPCVDGLGMLVEQAALSFELWTGFTPSTTEVIEQLRNS